MTREPVPTEKPRKRTRRRCIALDCGGASWAGWTFAPWGRSGELWLYAPDGTRFCAAELLELRELQRAVDYWQVHARELERLTAPGSVAFTATEAATLAAAAAIIARRAPRPVARKIGNVMELAKAAKK